MGHKKKANWREEFGEDYAVPPEVEALGKDYSWHNDISPSFGSPDDHNVEDHDLRLWVNHPSPNMREDPNEKRFLVVDSGQLLAATDDVGMAIRAYQDALLKNTQNANTDWQGRMYDLNKKGPSMTPEENEELRRLIREHGRLDDLWRGAASARTWVMANCKFASRS